ncbi:MAG: DNA polymerase III subunit delta' [Anaerolineales bacterium]|nr:DNA polymerase III subunit delta' [Anaerolineales bacterium]MDW8228138.1 DNA polymerase III subunit delta' [Anaerolineales bacterium]
MSNWNVIGHEWAVNLLRRQLLRKAFSHAYLFTGPAGVGRRTLALGFVRALVCPQPPEPGVPCGVCRTCRQIEAMRYPDLVIVQAEKEGGVLRVEQVREVRQSLVLKPYQGEYRFALFLRFHESNPSAANALLKTLEEAPSHAILLLTADTPEALLPTIVSRCQVVRLRSLPLQTLETALRERGATPEQARLLAHLSDGRPGLALRFLADSSLLDFRRQRLEELRDLLGSSRVERFAYAERLSDRRHAERERLRETLALWLTWWRDVMRIASGASIPVVNLEYRSDLETLAAQLGVAGARHLVVQAERAIRQLDANVNPRLLTEVVLLDWPRL